MILHSWVDIYGTTLFYSLFFFSVFFKRNFAKYTKALGCLIQGKEEATKLYKKCLDKYPNADSKDFQCILEAYIAETRRRQGVDEDSFSAEQITQVVLDTLSMGWETTMNSIHWIYIYLAMHPEVQVRNFEWKVFTVLATSSV